RRHRLAPRHRDGGQERGGWPTLHAPGPAPTIGRRRAEAERAVNPPADRSEVVANAAAGVEVDAEGVAARPVVDHADDLDEGIQRHPGEVEQDTDGHPEADPGVVVVSASGVSLEDAGAQAEVG